MSRGRLRPQSVLCGTAAHRSTASIYFEFATRWWLKSLVGKFSTGYSGRRRPPTDFPGKSLSPRWGEGDAH